MIAVGVVVPARDEQERVVACLHSVRRALERLPAGTASAVAVVLDRCVDRTPERVAALVAGWPQAEAVHVTHPASVPETPLDISAPETGAPETGVPGVGVPGVGTPGVGVPGVGAPGVGALRDLGIRRVLARLGAYPPERTWLLSTDADSTVPPEWVVMHLRHATSGAHAVAGLAELAGVRHLPVEALDRYQAIVASGVHGARHDHVYAANLGVRADAYLAVGGFPRSGPGEDHGLWRRLHVAGYHLEQPTDLRVRTSARVHGRAGGGLAELLRSLHPTRSAMRGGA